jgi:hypothetical protein
MGVHHPRCGVLMPLFGCFENVMGMRHLRFSLWSLFIVLLVGITPCEVKITNEITATVLVSEEGGSQSILLSYQLLYYVVFSYLLL